MNRIDTYCDILVLYSYSSAVFFPKNYDWSSYSGIGTVQSFLKREKEKKEEEEEEEKLQCAILYFPQPFPCHAYLRQVAAIYFLLTGRCK